MDSQLVELIGRAALQLQLLRDGIEVALPLRDRGIDMIAYLDRDGNSSTQACLLQMKAASKQAFSIDSKYQNFQNFKFAYVWHVHDPTQTRFFVVSYKEAEDLCRNYSWKQYGNNGFKRWSTPNPAKRFLGKLEKNYEVSKGQWRHRLFGSQ